MGGETNCDYGKYYDYVGYHDSFGETNYDFGCGHYENGNYHDYATETSWDYLRHFEGAPSSSRCTPRTCTTCTSEGAC